MYNSCFSNVDHRADKKHGSSLGLDWNNIPHFRQSKDAHIPITNTKDTKF